MPLYSSDPEDNEEMRQRNASEYNSLPVTASTSMTIPARIRNPSETSTATSQSTVASNEGSLKSNFVRAPAEDRSKYEKFIDADPDDDPEGKI